MLSNKIGHILMRQNPIHHFGVSAHCHQTPSCLSSPVDLGRGKIKVLSSSAIHPYFLRQSSSKSNSPLPESQTQSLKANFAW